MLNYLDYLDDKKRLQTQLIEVKDALGFSKILDKYGKQKIEYRGMSEMTFYLDCRVKVYEKWLNNLNKLTFKQKMFYQGIEYQRG